MSSQLRPYLFFEFHERLEQRASLQEKGLVFLPLCFFLGLFWLAPLCVNAPCTKLSRCTTSFIQGGNKGRNKSGVDVRLLFHTLSHTFYRLLALINNTRQLAHNFHSIPLRFLCLLCLSFHLECPLPLGIYTAVRRPGSGVPFLFWRTPCARVQIICSSFILGDSRRSSWVNRLMDKKGALKAMYSVRNAPENTVY